MKATKRQNKPFTLILIDENQELVPKMTLK
jgi:hypothetical protein